MFFFYDSTCFEFCPSFAFLFLNEAMLVDVIFSFLDVVLVVPVLVVVICGQQEKREF